MFYHIYKGHIYYTEIFIYSVNLYQNIYIKHSNQERKSSSKTLLYWMLFCIVIPEIQLNLG